MNQIDLKAQRKELSALASEVLELKNKSRPRRPLLIELCGSPKSGKSSCITALNIFLKRNNFRTKVLSERASVCPIRDKKDPAFNIWTVCSMLAELSEHLTNSRKDLDVILADRGIFDALCWFEWLKSNHHLSKRNYDDLVGFLTMPRWQTIVDIVFIFTVSKDGSMNREYANLLTDKEGSIMNPRVLTQFLESIEIAKKKYGKVFRTIESIDTTDIEQNSVSFEVTSKILYALREITMEHIAFFPRVSFKKFENKSVFSLSDVPKKSLLLKFDLRDNVEKDTSALQPIPIIVLTDKKRKQCLVLKKKKAGLSDHSPEAEKLLIYAGGHIRREDKNSESGGSFLSLARSSLRREIEEELGTALVPSDSDPICFWTKDNPKSEKHMAICFVQEVEDLRAMAVRLDENEFTQRKGKSESGKIFDVNDIASRVDQLEPWSISILRSVFRIDVGRVQRDLL